ncbi:MAG TPA: hypothetical protein VN455_07735, partial [Methanotrichaceae archaeon]|nr:hypothetical protein [Methanotrichaceae archaeon]
VQNPKKALGKLNSLIKLRGYMGGIVLRGKDIDIDLAGSLNVVYAWPPEIASGHQPIIVQSEPIDIDTKKVSISLLWNPIAFPRFAFELLAMLKGNFQPGYLPSLYGMPIEMPAKFF